MLNIGTKRVLGAISFWVRVNRADDTTEWPPFHRVVRAVHGSMNHDLPFLSQACKLFVIIGFYTKWEFKTNTDVVSRLLRRKGSTEVGTKFQHI